MADRSHLTPVRTVDRLGRATTVYRRLGADAPAGAAPIPALPQLSKTEAPASSVLPVPAKRSRWQIAALGRKLNDKDARRAFRAMASKQEGREAASLALDMLESGKLSEQVVLGTIRETAAVGPGLLSDSLRIAAPVIEVLAGRYGGFRDHWRREFSPGLQAVINGLRRADPLGPATINDESDLASATAVVLFIKRLSARGPSTDAVVSNQQTLESGVHQPRTYLRDEDLEQIVRDHPDRLDQIVEYAEAHDLTRPESVVSLRGMLDGDVAAPVADGWL